MKEVHTACPCLYIRRKSGIMDAYTTQSATSLYIHTYMVSLKLTDLWTIFTVMCCTYICKNINRELTPIMRVLYENNNELDIVMHKILIT